MRKFVAIIFIFGLALVGAVSAQAQTAEQQEELLKLNDTVQEKRTKLQELQDQVNEYKQEISRLQSKSVSLNNQVALLENGIAKTTLDIEALGVNMEKVEAEIEIIGYEIQEKQKRIDGEKKIIAEIVREINSYDQRSSVALLFGAKTFSDFYTHLHFLEDVQGRLQETMEEIKGEKAQQEEKRVQRENQLTSLGELQKELEQKQLLLEDERGSKQFLLATTRSSEAEFQNLLREIKEETQFLDAQLGTLETQLSDRLKGFDVDFGGGTLFSHPLGVGTYVTAHFHDPTYPWRYMFEHSGTDFRAAHGTPVKAAAPGIVAVAREAKMYGNYVVLIHANGFSTVYGHLSQLLVSPEQFVERGQVIGMSGGTPGTRGAGFSNGPHLHFEVRVNGIPVNSLEYLVGL